jgi:hypothetical protein
MVASEPRDRSLDGFGQNETVLVIRTIHLFPVFSTSNFAAIVGTMELVLLRAPAMKTKIGVYLTDDVARRLKGATRRRRATKSDLVNEALRRLFDPPAPAQDRSEEILRLVQGLAKRLRRLHRELQVTSETLALFVRYYLMVAPPIQESERRAAEALGRERYAVFIRQIAKRITSDKGMITEVVRTIVMTHPHLVAEAMAEARGQKAIRDMFLADGQASRPGECAENPSHA